MEIKKIENCNYVMFPRLQWTGLKPKYVERNAFRAETRQDAITPDSLGSLLHKMVDMLRLAWGAATHPFYHIECDTKDGRLLNSPVAVRTSADGKISEVHLSQAFLEYGLWQDYGTGKEVPRGNSGDLGKPKVRKERHWFSRKYYMSVMNIKEFMSDSLGKQFMGIVADALSQKRFSRAH